MLSACSTLSYTLTLRTEMLGAGGTLVAECLVGMPKSLDAIPRTTNKWINRQKGNQRNKNHYLRPGRPRSGLSPLVSHSLPFSSAVAMAAWGLLSLPCVSFPPLYLSSFRLALASPPTLFAGLVHLAVENVM